MKKTKINYALYFAVNNMFFFSSVINDTKNMFKNCQDMQQGISHDINNYTLFLHPSKLIKYLKGSKVFDFLDYGFNLKTLRFNCKLR